MFNELIFFHVTVCVMYYMIRAQHNGGQAFCETAIVFFIPGFGLAFLVLLRIFEKLKFADEDPSYIYKNFENDCIPLLEHDQQTDSILPMQDALLLEDTKTKRRLLSDAIKKDVLQNNNILLSAVRDEDSEISHYAVSMVNRKIRDLEAVFYRLHKKLKATPNDVTALKEYVNVVDVYLKSSSLDTVSQVKLQEDYTAILERLLHLDGSEKKYFLMKINCEIELQNYKKAEEFCHLFLQHFPHSEEPHLLSIKLSYYLLDYQKIRQAIQGLKNSEVQFSKEALEIIRFWDRGEPNAS